MRRSFRPRVKARSERRWLVRRERDDDVNEREEAILNLGGEEKQAPAR
jgi:hypothetical protein